MTFGILFYILFCLFIKHLMIDFPIYSGYACRNTLGFSALWAGHIVAHGVATFAIFALAAIPWWICGVAALMDTVSHWIIDTWSAYVNQRSASDPEFGNKYKWFAELDQFLHNLVYVTIAFVTMLLL